MNPLLLQSQVQDYLRENIHLPPDQLALSKSPFADISSSDLVQQLNGLQRAKQKLPTIFINPKIYYPPNLNLEQSSSELTAAYKAKILGKGKILDITGGFGVDSFAFAKAANHVTHCEINQELSRIVQNNANAFGLDNISFEGDGIDFLKSIDHSFDSIYIDPSRRHKTKGKVSQLTDYQPNVVENLELLLEKCEKLLIKTSPLFDISQGIRELKKVSEIYIVAVDGEVKETLYLLEKESRSIRINIIKTGDEPNCFSCQYPVENYISEYSEVRNYLYEPHAGLMKAACWQEIADEYEVGKLAINSHLFTSIEYRHDFFGRSFEVQEVLEYKPKLLKNKLPNKANVAVRNFRESVREIRKRLQITDGGEDYLFFTRDMNDKSIVVVCKKIK